MRRVVPVALATACLALAGCQAPAATPSIKVMGLSVESPWVRTTDGATNTQMTAMFLTLVNPTSVDRVLTKADCSPVAGMTQVHEMVMKDGKMVMQEAPNGAPVPSGRHLHMVPGGYHVMLMKLTKPLPVGEEVRCTLTLDDGTTLAVTAPVKVYTEEEEHYHEGETPRPGSTATPMK